MRTRPLLEAVEPRLLMATFLVSRSDDGPANSIGGLTLRQAMELANATPGADSILFTIGPGVQTISPDRELPLVIDPLTIDGSVTGNFPTQQIVIEGSLAPAGSNGLTFASSNNAVRGLSILGFGSATVSSGGVVGGSGIVLLGGNNLVAGNRLGNAPVPLVAATNNNRAGLLVGGPGNNTIGGTAPADRNVISGNFGTGIEVGGLGGSVTGNLVLGNYIGTDFAGTGDLGNGLSGLFLSTPGNTIGGLAPGARNVISGNGFSGISISGLAANGNLIQGNYVGTNASGTGSLGNGLGGIDISTSNNTIGGATPAARNVVSGNSFGGIAISGSSISGNLVLGNFVGPNAAGTGNLGNTGDGISIDSSSGNTIGGTVAGVGNVIAFNSGNGVAINIGAGNAVLTNSIFSNAGLGIDLVQVNAAPVAPVLVTPPAGATSFSGSLSGAAGTSYRVEFFLNDQPDPSGFGEGQTFFGATVVTIPTGGVATFTFPLPQPAPVDRYLTATATTVAGGTSEFSQAVLLAASVPDLALSLVDDPDPVPVGGILSYTLTVTNNGTGVASLVNLTNDLPAGVDFLSVQSANPAVFTPPSATLPGGRVSVAIDALAVGASATVTILVRPRVAGVIVDQAAVTSSEPDRNPVDDTISITTTVFAVVDLGIAVTAAPDPVFVDDLLTYTITVTNRGPSRATNVVVTDLISDAAVFVAADSAFPSAFTPPVPSGPGAFPATVAFAVGDLDPNQTVTLRVIVRPDVAGTFGNIAVVTANEPDIAPDDERARVDSRFVFSFVVTNAGNAGPGSLRRVIANADRNPGPETITFLIPSNQPVISPTTPLPLLTGPTVLDATTQPGFSGSPIVVLSGSLLVPSDQTFPTEPGAGRNGLNLGSGVTVRGLEIREFPGSGIAVLGGSNNSIVGNFLRDNGEDGLLIRAAGDVEQPVNPARGNTIGGTTPADRNVISGNGSVGVFVSQGTAGTLIQGNRIGTDPSGQRPRGNTFDGILISNSPDTTIGGTAAGAGNVVSGNGEVNIQVFGAPSARTVIQGNRIGTDADGTTVLEGAGEDDLSNVGVLINDAPLTLVGGAVPEAMNLISGHGAGVQIFGSGGLFNRVVGNRIGTNLDGTRRLRNQIGVFVSSASGNTIGGLSAGERNLISGNSRVGVRISGASASQNVVVGNYVGLDASGRRALGNAFDGIFVDNAPGTTIGGTAAGSANVVSGNGSAGVQLFGGQASGNVVSGNRIGTTAEGGELEGSDSGTREGSVGVFLNDSPGNTIGGTTPPEGNLIAFFRQAGIQLSGTTATGNLIASNTVRDIRDSGIAAEQRAGNVIPLRGPSQNVLSDNGRAFLVIPTAGPTVVNVDEVTDGGNIRSIVVTYSRLLAPDRSSDPRSYRLEILNRRGRRVRFTSIVSAVYSESTRSVTLTPGSVLPAGGRYRLTVLGRGPRGVRDINGVLLDGDLDGVPGSNFVTELDDRDVVQSSASRRAVAVIRRARNTPSQVVGMRRAWHTMRNPR